MITESDIKRIRKYEQWTYRKLFRNNSYYGRGKLLRQILGLPAWFPILPYLQHGVSYLPIEVRKKIYGELPYSQIIFFSKYEQQLFADLPGKEILHFPDVFPLYRKVIRPRFRERVPEKKRGTLYFPAHSSDSIQVDNDQQAIIAALRQLPIKFQPVTICIYWKDVLQGKHLPYVASGFDVVTNGHRLDQDFHKIFYDNLLSYEYTAGNKLGSHSFYSVEAGTPHFLYGALPVSVSSSGYQKNQLDNYSLKRQKPSEEYFNIESVFTFPGLNEVVISEAILAWTGKKLGCFDNYDVSKTKAIIQEAFYSNPVSVLASFKYDLKMRLGR